MATQVYSGMVNNTSDAYFRKWSQDLHNAIVAAGMVQTADTGQITFASAVKPTSSSTSAGYTVYRFNDSQQSTAPLFVRLDWGTGNAASAPGLRITIGSGSSGSGAITGAYVTNFLNGTTSNHNTTNLFQTRVCVRDGLFWFASGMGASSNGCSLFLMIARRANQTTATPAGTGFTWLSHSNGTYSGGRHNTATGYGGTFSNGAMALNVSEMGATLVDGADPQALIHFAAYPNIEVNPFAVTVNRNELGNNAQFPLAPLAGVSRNFVSLGAEGSTSWANLCAPDMPLATLALVWD